MADTTINNVTMGDTTMGNTTLDNTTIDDKKKNSFVIFMRQIMFSSLHEDALNSHWDVSCISNEFHLDVGRIWTSYRGYEFMARFKFVEKIYDSSVSAKAAKVITQADILLVDIEKYTEAYTLWGRPSSVKPIIVLIDDQYYANKYTGILNNCNKIKKDGWHDYMPDAIYPVKMNDKPPKGMNFFRVGTMTSSAVIVENFADIVLLFEKKNNVNNWVNLLKTQISARVILEQLYSMFHNIEGIIHERHVSDVMSNLTLVPSPDPTAVPDIMELTHIQQAAYDEQMEIKNKVIGDIELARQSLSNIQIKLQNIIDTIPLYEASIKKRFDAEHTLDKALEFLESLESLKSSSHDSDSNDNDVNNKSDINNASSSKTANELDCSICLNNRKSMMCYPCRHLCMCKDCSQNIKKCPLCRTNIESFIEVYI
jgi:hypothetical protein